MDREQDTAELIELGTASIDTLGAVTGIRPEASNFYPLGFSQD